MMGTTEPEAYGPTHNPWNLDRSPGGSSGGSGAAVAAGYVPVAHANDIAGSIRIPASQCGLVGLKPTRGRVIPNRSFDAAVTMVSEGVVTPDDARHGRRCSTASPTPRSRGRGRRPRFPVLSSRSSAATRDSCASGCASARSPARRSTRAARRRLATPPPCSRRSATASRRRGRPRSTSPTCWAARRSSPPCRAPPRSTSGRPRSAERSVRPTWSRRRGRPSRPAGRCRAPTSCARSNGCRRCLGRSARGGAGPDRDGFDLLLTPTTAEPGPELGAYKRGFKPGRGSAFTRVFNATGQPALSLPLGWPDDGLPRGVQLVAAYGREDVLIRVGSQLEEAAPWADRRPPLA